MVDNKISFGEGFNTSIIRHLLQVIIPQIMQGHRELLAFTLLSVKPRLEKISTIFDNRLK